MRPPTRGSQDPALAMRRQAQGVAGSKPTEGRFLSELTFLPAKLTSPHRVRTPMTLRNKGSSFTSEYTTCGGRAGLTLRRTIPSRSNRSRTRASDLSGIQTTAFLSSLNRCGLSRSTLNTTSVQRAPSVFRASINAHGSASDLPLTVTNFCLVLAVFILYCMPID